MARATTKKAEYAFTDEAPPLPTVAVPEGDAKVQAQAWLEDAVVRAVREAGHCTEALTILDKVFGKPLDEVGVYDVHGHYGRGSGSLSEKRLFPAYLDSDGRDCWNNQWRDKDGFSRDGLDPSGRDKDGYDKHGYDVAGYDREGKDRDGLHKDDPARFMFDPTGRDKDGYDKDGYDRDGYNREGVSRGGSQKPEWYVFDKDGYGADGYDRRGYNRAGNYSEAAYLNYREIRRASF